MQNLVDACNESAALDVTFGALVYEVFDETISEAGGAVTRVFRFPRACTVIGLFAGVVEDQANPMDQNPLTIRQGLDLAIVDEAQVSVVTSGTAAIAADTVNSLTLTGRGQRWFPLRKRVKSGDTWTITGSVIAANGNPASLFQCFVDLRIQNEDV
jgi:hypothetical protein